jgi:hypothetical protein
MTPLDIDALGRAWSRMEFLGTHSEECIMYHHRCAIARLLAIVRAADAMRAAVDKEHPCSVCGFGSGEVHNALAAFDRVRGGGEA